MATKANPFQNRENYAKYLALYFEPGLTALLTTLEWCYEGQRPIEEHLADLGATNSLCKKNKIYATEQNTLEELKNSKTNLNDLDITLIYKIIQLTCNLLPIKDVVPGELEHLLLELKNGRNLLAHPGKELKNTTDSMVEDKCEEMKDLLTKLLQAAATKRNVHNDKLKIALDEIEDNIHKIKIGKNICDSISPQTFQLIVEGLRSNESSNDQLKEIKEYSAPKLKKNNYFQPLKNILQLNNSSVIVVRGEAGMGKTAMSRFLSNSWLSGNMDSVEGLSSFDVVIRVGCNQISSSDINLFYERLFPTSFSFTNTNSFKKSLDEFNVFWIMDGFDECTAEFKGFLTEMTDSLSEKHKLLITTRPHTYEDLKGCLGKLSMTSLSLELLEDHNMEEIIQSLITEDEKKKTFKTHTSSLYKTANDLLKTPLNLNLCIKLWKQDPELVTNIRTTEMLFLKTIDHNLSLLSERLYRHSDLSSKEDLKDSLNGWFYGSLCKQSFLMLMKDRLNIISKEDQDTLKKDARKFSQNTSMCLSTFLVQEKKNDWEDEGESENDDDDEESENEEEDKGEFRYEFHHLTQQFILAFLFLKHFKDYDGENVINSISIELFKTRHIKRLYELIKFYVKMIIEDGSLDNDLTQVFSPIQSIINTVPKIEDNSTLWLTTSVASKFNVKYMEKVSQAFKNIPSFHIYCSVYNFNYSTNFITFLEFVRPQKIILRYFSYASIHEKYFQPLLEFLINSKLEIEIKYFDEDYPSFEANDAFCGQYFFFHYYSEGRNWTEKMKTICIKLINKYEFNKIDFETLKEYKALEQLKIRINLHSFSLSIPTNIHNIPKEMIEITTIGINGLNMEIFEKVLEVLNKMKGEETLKFKALIHDFEDISETDKRQLQQIAHTVSIDFICQCKKDAIEKIVKLNITSFVGYIQMLNTLNACHANLKSVFLIINYKWELCRTLKFLRDYKANLDDVTITLYRSFPEFVNPENRTSAIPDELVQRTTIFIRYAKDDNFDEYLTLLNNLRGDETLKFKAIYTDHRRLSPHQLEMLNQITVNSLHVSNSYNMRYFMCDST